MNPSHSIYARIAQALALLMAVALLGSCTSPDAEYAGVLAVARTACKGDEVVGVWMSSSPEEKRRGEKASILMFRPDGTGLRRTIFRHIDGAPDRESTTTSFVWRYQGAGIWTSGTATIRFAGNALTWDLGGAWLPNIRYTIYIRTGNDSLNDVMKPHP